MKLKKTKSTRFNMVMPDYLKIGAEKKAAELGISTSEYIKDLIKRDLKNKSSK